MQLSADECWEHLKAAERGVLCTTNARGEIDAVPVCFAVVGRRVATPVDRVKPKRTTALARVENLERNPAATLLCDHWDGDDWSRLWWVRARLVRRSGLDLGAQVRRDCDDALRAKYTQYGDEDFADVLVFDVTQTRGWSGARP